MHTVKVFKLGRAQAVRIPARFRFDVDEVQVFQRGDELVLRAKPRTAADVFARAREKYGAIDIPSVPRSKKHRPIRPLDF